LLARAQLKIDPQVRSSMWDHLVRLAETQGVDAPMNRRIMQSVHEAEAKKSGSPGMSHVPPTK
jgi:ketopantoate reductase